MVTGAIDAYAIALRRLTAEQLRTGVAAAIDAGGPHPPSAGDLRKLCLGNDRQSLEARAHEAFQRADWAARREGITFNPRRLDDPLLMHALGAVGGWRVFCETVNEWQQRNFVEAYVSAGDNPAVAEVAKLSHNGKPLGALSELRESVARSLTTPTARLPAERHAHRTMAVDPPKPSE